MPWKRTGTVEPSGGEGEAGPGNRLDADVLILDLGEQMDPRLVRARRTGTSRPRLNASKAGVLTSDEIEFHVQEGDGGEVIAEGDVRWEASPEVAAGIWGVRASSLDLVLGPGGLEAARAAGAVIVELVAPEEGSAASLRGERVELAWEGEALTTGLWPDRCQLPRRKVPTLQAEEGRYDPRSGQWVMEGTPRPRLSGDQYDVSAD